MLSANIGIKIIFKVIKKRSDKCFKIDLIKYFYSYVGWIKITSSYSANTMNLNLKLTLLC